jgi:hypothetical protein
MLSILKGLFVASPAPRDGEAFERFGESRAARKLGEEALFGSAARKGLVLAIRDRLEHLTKAEKRELVDRLLVRFALFVFDLPASERHHHARPYGLLDHSLEVARKAVGRLSEPSFRVSPDPIANHRERPLWIYSALVLGLAHDAGKVLDLEVALPDGRDRWDPVREPLAAFAARNGLAGTGPAFWRFRPGRGLHAHKAQALEVLPLLFTPEIRSYLGGRLEEALALYFDQTASGVCEAARAVVEAVRECDRESAGREYWSEVKREEEAPKAPDPEPARVREPETPLPPTHRPRGDEGELARRLEHELDPARLLETLRRMILAKLFSVNGLYTDVYLREDYVWLVVPRALRRFARHVRIPFDHRVEGRILEALGACPNVEPLEGGKVRARVEVRPEGGVVLAVRIRRAGFLSDSDARKIGYWPHAVTAAPARSEPGVAGWHGPL